MAVTDIEERARHLALSTDGPEVALSAELDATAAHAAGRGAMSAAAELAEVAASLTPTSEPKAGHRRRLRRPRSTGSPVTSNGPQRSTTSCSLCCRQAPPGRTLSGVSMPMSRVVSRPTTIVSPSTTRSPPAPSFGAQLKDSLRGRR